LRGNSNCNQARLWGKEYKEGKVGRLRKKKEKGLAGLVNLLSARTKVLEGENDMAYIVREKSVAEVRKFGRKMENDIVSIGGQFNLASTWQGLSL